jgi:MAF protein
VDGDDILGKPVDRRDAKRILRQLRGHIHQVYSAVAVLRAADGQLWTDVCQTDVPMRIYLDEEIESYVASGDPMDKAGAYAIQHRKFCPVENIQGCYANVVGLPLCHLTRVMRKMNIHPMNDIPDKCQTMLHYECSVYESYLY